MKEKLVSIIISTYNRDMFIKETIDSCLSQSYKNIEIIVVDDGSTNNIKRILEEYIDSDEIIYIYQDNKGISEARNNGLSQAKGEYIQFLDDDDLISSDKIKNQVTILEENPEYFACYCKAKYFKNTKENVIFELSPNTNENFYEQMLKKNILAINSVLFKKSNIIFDCNLTKLEDWDFWINHIKENRKFKFDNQSICFVRVHSNNVSKDMRKMIESEIQVLEKNLNLLEDDGSMCFNIFKKMYFLNDDTYKKYEKLSAKKQYKYKFLAQAYKIKYNLKRMLKLDKNIYS